MGRPDVAPRRLLVALGVSAGLAAASAPATDLSEILAPPPSSAWNDVTDSSGPTLSGAFDAQRYAEWLASSPTDVSGFRASFEAMGLTRGYARSWSTLSKSPPQVGYSRLNYLVETVEEYSSDIGSRSRFDGVKNALMPGGEDFVRQLPTSLPDSYAAVTNSGNTFLVVLMKGNDVYIVRMHSFADDLSQAVLKQAEVQYGLAPAGTTPPENVPTPQPRSSPAAAVKIANAEQYVGAGAVVVIALAVLLIYFGRRRNPTG